MSFDYDKIHKSNDHGSWWTSYADLFMMLSIVFLLMYVASSLRSGSAGFQQQVAYKQLEKKAQDLEEQIKVYNTLKDESLKSRSNEQEQEVYKKLMDHLNLLQDEAHGEKLSLEQKAKENADKEFALNQYQQLIRNIINTNVLAKSQIIRRDQMIVTKDATIEEKQKAIAQLEGTITNNQHKITAINNELESQIAALKDAKHNSKISNIIYERRLATLKKDSQDKVEKLEANSAAINVQLSQVRGTLVETQKTLATTSENLSQQQAANDALRTKLQREKAQYVAELDGLREQHQAQLAAERAAFERGLKKQQLSHAAKAKKMADYIAREKQRAAQLEGKLSGLEGKIADTESQLQGTQAKLQGTQAALQGTQSALQGTQAKLAGAEADRQRALANVQSLQTDLDRTREIAFAKRKLADQIAKEFARAGVKGVVNGKTGEVTLDFGQEYFDTGSTMLKPKMMTTLDKFIPLYAKGLFNDPKVADKIASVEVVGFASSTYKGHYVNPKSVRTQDKEAIDYNLRLSFGRANSIFKHVLNEQNLSKADRDKLLPLMKVVGRGYLPEGVNADNLPDSMTEKQFCAKYNCQKAQKVIVKFNMKD